MIKIVDYPLLVFAISFVGMWFSAWLGPFLRRRLELNESVRDDFGLIMAATLTLLGLIIGFTFSMALNRYDQRKNYEEEEANAIGTEFVRASLLPAEASVNVRALLVGYLDQRIHFYQTQNSEELANINAQTAKLQSDLWTAVQKPAVAQPSPLIALAVSGMNDVLNSQGYTQAAWWNRIPVAAWGLMGLIAICSNLLVGYGARKPKEEVRMLLILPLIVAVAFFLIADIDSPRGGLIHVVPQNLISLAQSLRTQ